MIVKSTFNKSTIQNQPLNKMVIPFQVQMARNRPPATNHRQDHLESGDEILKNQLQIQNQKRENQVHVMAAAEDENLRLKMILEMKIRNQMMQNQQMAQ